MSSSRTIAGLVVIAAVLGARWWASVAWAERAAGPAVESGVAPDLFAKSRGFRELLEAVRERGGICLSAGELAGLAAERLGLPRD